MMSCFMVDRNHIRYLVASGESFLKAGGLSETRLGCEDLGKMLWDENAASVQCRYPDTVASWPDNVPGEIGENFIYDTHKPAIHHCFDPLRVISACQCYAYQACEHSGWEASDSKAYTDRLIDAAISKLMPDGVWGAPDLGRYDARTVKGGE